MDLPANFKFDVRIRSRLLAKGQLNEADVAKHLEALADSQPQADAIDLAQPALTSPEERERLAAARPSGLAPRPVASAPLERSSPISIAPTPEPVDEGWEDDDEDDVDDDDDDDDDDVVDEDVKPKVAAVAAVPEPVPPSAPAAAAAAPVADAPAVSAPESDAEPASESADTKGEEE